MKASFYKQTLQKIFFGVFIALGVHSGFAQIQNKNFEIGKNIEIFVDVYKQVNANYVDEIDVGDLMKKGIDNLLENLDPYTVYIPESQIEDYRIATTGQYGGIGALIHSDGKYIIITDPYKNSPAKKAGIKAGDRILKINGKNASEKNDEEISQLMKGQVGGTVELEIERYGEPKPLHFSVVREMINIESVDYFEKLKNNVAYIKLDGFTPNSGSAVKDAFVKMRAEETVTGLILDLRGNGGGLLGEAVNIVNLFVKAGQDVVSMRGQIASSNQTFKTTQQPVDTDIPVIVLVDEHSASASEIVSGALQDLDRAVIMGQRTYGKGLVQNIFPAVYNSQVKVTVAKYYIPSGRCIQAIDYSHKDALGKWEKVPDSLITKFATLGGRPVYDGAGIEPDVLTKPYVFNDITTALVSEYILFNFVTQYYYKNPTVPPIDSFEITEDIWNQFIAWLKEHNDNYRTHGQILLANLQNYYKTEPCPVQIQESITELVEKMNAQKIDAIQENRAEIYRMLKLEILSRYYDYNEYIKFSVEFDPEIKQAMELIANEKQYKSILKTQ